MGPSFIMRQKPSSKLPFSMCLLNEKDERDEQNGGAAERELHNKVGDKVCLHWRAWGKRKKEEEKKNNMVRMSKKFPVVPHLFYSFWQSQCIFDLPLCSCFISPWLREFLGWLTSPGNIPILSNRIQTCVAHKLRNLRYSYDLQMEWHVRHPS